MYKIASQLTILLKHHSVWHKQKDFSVIQWFWSGVLQTAAPTLSLSLSETKLINTWNNLSKILSHLNFTEREREREREISYKISVNFYFLSNSLPFGNHPFCIWLKNPQYLAHWVCVLFIVLIKSQLRKYRHAQWRTWLHTNLQHYSLHKDIICLILSSFLGSIMIKNQNEREPNIIHIHLHCILVDFWISYKLRSWSKLKVQNAIVHSY